MTMTDNCDQRTRALLAELRSEIDSAVDDEISAIIRNMPEEYFLSLSHRDQMTHLKALLAMTVCSLQEEIMLRSEDGSQIAVIAKQSYPGLLANILKRLPNDLPLIGAVAFTSKQHDFIIDLFQFKSPETDETNGSWKQTIDATTQQVTRSTGASANEVAEFIRSYHRENHILALPDEVAEQFQTFQALEHPNDIAVRWLAEPEDNLAKIVVAVGSVGARDVFERAAEFLAQNSVDIEQAFFDDLQIRPDWHTAILTFNVSAVDQPCPEFSSERLRICLRVDQEVIDDHFQGGRFADIEAAELFHAVSRLAGHLIHFGGSNVPFHKVHAIALNQREYVGGLLDQMQRRLGGNHGQGPHDNQGQPLASVKTNSPTNRLVLSTIESVARHVTAWNLDQPKRRCLALRLGPEAFQTFTDKEAPFAVFYISGNGFDGFHVRFRDVARGGMRLVTTRDQEHYLIESGRGFEEAYSLAAAQQLKNKDIAEGGAKATIVLKPGVNPDRAGRDFIEGLLDLIIGTAEEDTELLYLGPDENVSPKLIDWIVQRSAQRGYPFPNAIMSSKPRSGVNHKEFGVTSEGVTAFLKHALQYASIDPETDSFSVKLTGGPDGDVAGNEIKILIREFGPRVKFVGFADGSGSAVDPDGLDHHELLRLVDQQQPLAAFDTSLLSSRGYASGLSTREDVERRDDLQFNVKSDVFIPAGGRPFTINRSNWTAYFDEHGTPAARIVIEGANLFVQDAARKELSDRGVIIVQDSSANKCGVICSSLEIVSGMLLSERQFLKSNRFSSRKCWNYCADWPTSKPPVSLTIKRDYPTCHCQS